MSADSRELQPLRVLMAASSFPQDLQDWKSVFIRHLAEAIGALPDVALSLWAPHGECESSVSWATTSDDVRMLDSLMSSGGIAHLLRNHPPRGVLAALNVLWRLRRACMRGDYAVYHMNWLQNAIALPSDGRPAVVTALGSDLAFLRLPLVRTLLRRRFASRATVLCPNADWMVEPLNAAFGDVATIRFVPFGIDPVWFAVERGESANQAPRWLAVTRVTHAKLGTLLDHCAAHFSGGSRELHLIGPMQDDIQLPEWVHYHGPASPDELSSRWFPDATGLITLSRHAEGRPQVMLEAMAAALPIIASDIPAHASFLEHDKTGLLVRDSTDLATALETLEDPATNRRVGTAARRWVTSEVGTWSDCAQRFTAIYRQLTGDIRQ